MGTRLWRLKSNLQILFLTNQIMSKAQLPELKKFMDKTLFITLNGNRTIKGTLRGYDVFMNLSLEDAYEIRHVPKSEHAEEKNMHISMGMTVVRGNSILLIDCHEY